MASNWDLKNWIELENKLENPFAFGNWRLPLVEPRKSNPRTHCLENVQYDLGLHICKQLSSLSKTDFCSTNITPDSTRNASKDLDALNECHIYPDDVYAISESSSSDRQNDNPKTSVSNNLTPVTIMVVENISAIKSKKMLRVL